jgi:glutathione S-transferase
MYQSVLRHDHVLRYYQQFARQGMVAQYMENEVRSSSLRCYTRLTYPNERLTLNFKEIPYKTEFLELPDVQKFCIEKGIPPTRTWNDGSPFYTFPVIHDPSTRVYLADSLAIARYLEKTYPETPVIFPAELDALQAAYTSACASELNSVWRIAVPEMAKLLEGRALEYYRFTREKNLGKKLEEVAPVGEEKVTDWKRFKEGFDNIDGWLKQNSKTEPFVLGNRIIWADFVLGGLLLLFKRMWGEDSEEWKEIKGWNGGRWEALLRELQPYSQIK